MREDDPEYLKDPLITLQDVYIMVTGHPQSFSDSNPQRRVNNGSTTVTDTSGELVVMAANQNEKGVICHYQVQLAMCSGGSEWKSD